MESLVKRRSRDSAATTLNLDPDTWAAICRALAIPAQQLRVVELVLQGMGDKEIAASLGLRVPTVRTYLTRIYQRTGVRDRTNLILLAFAIAQTHWQAQVSHQE